MPENPWKDDMNKPQKPKDESLKSGTSRRSRLGRAGQGGTMPRIMVAALLVIAAGGAALFWPRGGGVPTGIGDQHTMVTAQEDSTLNGQPPRSGDVDIATESAPPLTPEKPEGQTVPERPTETEVKKVQVPPEQVVEKAVEKPKPKKATPPAKKTTEPKVLPQATGSYAVQVGAFGQAENADTEAARLKALGWDARVRAGNNSSGEMVFRVWVCFFANRDLAQTFINQNSRHLRGAIVVHR
jgi:cell division protein FtsN